METKRTNIGISIVLISLLIANLVILGATLSIFSYPPVLVSSIFIILAYLVIIRQVGILSATSIFCMFIIYPSVVPVLSDYIFRVPNYTLRAVPYQNQFLIEMGVFLVAACIWIIAGISISSVEPSDKRTNTVKGLRKLISEYDHTYNKYSFVVISCIVIFSAYLTTPGPTILTVSYSTVIDNYYSWATFAGNLYIGSWGVLLLVSRQTEKRSIRYYFYLITLVTVLWLLLHARRNESLGVLLALVFVYGHRFRLREVITSLRTFAVTCLGIAGSLLFVVVGQVRSGYGNISIESLFLGSTPTGASIQLPGGAHNIFGTFQFTIHYYYNNYLWGSTFLNYPVQSIPSPILSVIPIQQAPYYFDSMREHYQLYNGGNYFLNEYFANFGPYGVVLAAVVFGLLISQIDQIFTRNSIDIWTGLSVAFVAAIPRAMWYWQGNWINAILGYILTYIVYLLVLNVSNIVVRSEMSLENTVFVEK